MQPFHEKEGSVAGVFLHRHDGEKREPEILQLLNSIGDLLEGFPELAAEHSLWRAHNIALEEAGLEPIEVPSSLKDYDKVVRLEESAYVWHHESERPEDYDTVVVTAEEAASIDALKLGPEAPTLSLEATSFLMNVCGLFDTEAEQSLPRSGGGINC